jgi:hypothetical protein
MNEKDQKEPPAGKCFPFILQHDFKYGITFIKDAVFSNIRSIFDE